MKPPWKRWLVRSVKLVLALVILFFVGWQFKGDLEYLKLDEIELRPGWLLFSAGLYLVGNFPGAWFWRHLHGKFGYPISLYAAVRAHYIGQLGKYVPGKAMAIAIRSDLIHPCGVPYGVSIIVSFYEVFTGMASAALVAALIYLVQPPSLSELPTLAAGLEWHPFWIGLVLIGVCGVPLLPGVFNFLIAKLTARIQAVELYRLPPVRFGTLATGLLAAGAGSWVQGLSVWAMLQAVLPEPPELTPATWAQCTAGTAFAGVAGFVVVVAPAGLGVREYLLRMLLSSIGPAKYIAVSVLLLRLVWIVAEACFAAVTYWHKPAGQQHEPAESSASNPQAPG
jgi:glycosyltransferase 2 family protein